MNLLEVKLLGEGLDLIDGLIDEFLRLEPRLVGNDAVVGRERSVDAANVIPIEGLSQSSGHQVLVLIDGEVVTEQFFPQ